MTPYRDLIVLTAQRHGLSPNLVEGVVLRESSGHTDAFRFEPEFYATYLKDNPEWAGWVARRAASSYGLMQILYPTARELGFRGEPEELFQPAVGLEWGCRQLAALLVWAKGDVARALAAYNGGRGGVGRPVPQDYARGVLALVAEVERSSPATAS